MTKPQREGVNLKRQSQWRIQGMEMKKVFTGVPLLMMLRMLLKFLPAARI